MELENFFNFTLDDEEATQKLGRDLSLLAKPEDVFALMGDLGAGKTTFARSFIRHFTNQQNLEVPSPTFNLVLEYNEALQRAPLFHYDLYRLGDPSELEELGIDEALSQGVSLIEWPENAGDIFAENSLLIQLAFKEDGNGRIAKFYGSKKWQERWTAFQKIDEFLKKNLNDFQRYHMMGDASLRHYEKIISNDKTYVLMNDPKRDGGPLIRDGKTYAEIAHISLSVDAFIGVCNLLRSKKYCAPKIFDFDLDAGLILLEFLGADSIATKDKKPIESGYQLAVEFLAEFHQNDWPDEAPINDDIKHFIPPFDGKAQMIEVELFLSWYVPRFNQSPLSKGATQDFYDIWKCLIDKALEFETSLTLRDYHSPNIIWRKDVAKFDQIGRIGQIGLIDFQDAMIGPSTYDVISICNDARVDISREFEQTLKGHYLKARWQRDKNFSQEEFLENYAIMAAQRSTKILGGFVRSDERDGKPTYLAYLPRMKDYLLRALEHPILNDYKAWIKAHELL